MAEAVLKYTDVNPEWVTSLLRSQGHSATVRHVSRSSIGTGQVGATYRYALTYQGDQGAAPNSLVGKFQSNDPLSRDTGKMTLTYLREAGFYRQFGITKSLPVPEMLFLAFDEDSHDFAMIMRDLPHHYAGNQLKIPSQTEAELAMDAAAAIHAAWWHDPALDANAWMSGAHASTAPVEPEGFYAMLWPAFCDRYGDRITADMRSVGEAYLGKIIGWQNALAAAPRCLTHNDYRPDNMLFAPDDSLEPIVIVDWQTVGVGCGATDIAYYLGTAFDAEIRRLHEAALFARYTDALIQHGVPATDIADLWRHCQISAFAGFMMGVTASMIVQQTERGDAMFLAMCERSTAMVLDHYAVQF
jgi:aminoglycoside phosphotransferase (APT) family kinase protein